MTDKLKEPLVTAIPRPRVIRERLAAMCRERDVLSRLLRVAEYASMAVPVSPRADQSGQRLAERDREAGEVLGTDLQDIDAVAPTTSTGPIPTTGTTGAVNVPPTQARETQKGW